MPETPDHGRELIEHLDRIRRSGRTLCRRSGVGDDETEDCCSWVVLRIVEDDYAILRKFKGRSQLGTYLNVVVSRLVADWRTEHWGRWRPSAVARRLGPEACMLERLVYRDRMTLAEAITHVRSRLGAAAPTERELAALFRKIPRRAPLRPRLVGEDDLVGSASADSATHEVDQSERASEWDRIHAAIETALNTLHETDATDATIARLHLFDGAKVAEIARALRLEQGPLYRRLDRVLERLLAELERLGFPRARLRDYLNPPE